MKCLILNLKMERVRRRGYANHSKAIYNMADYIVNFYNFVWLHSKLGNWSPNLFKHQLATQPAY